MTETVSLSPDAVCIPRLGVAHLTRLAFAGTDLRPLWDEMMQKATDDQAGSGRAMDLSVIAQLLGDQATGLAIQKETVALQQLYLSPCAVSPRLRVLAFAAVNDIGGNTPLEFLLRNSDIELVTFYVVPGMALPFPMPDHDVAIVIAPDSEKRDTLETIEALAAIWPRPILNPPRNIAHLGRDRLCDLLKDISGLDIPHTARAAREKLTLLAKGDLAVQDILRDGVFPLIIRPLSSHAGFGLDKLADGAALLAYLANRPEPEFFVSRFVDYSGADGLFRKYRLVVVDGQTYACHMAIAEEWKIWYLNADMAVSVPNRVAEALFMRNFDEDFILRHGAALQEMIARIGLDYFTIDCAETPSGALLIFEADNTAIVHDMDPPAIYPYKLPQMQKIFQAVQDMCYRRAGQTKPSAA